MRQDRLDPGTWTDMTAHEGYSCCSTWPWAAPSQEGVAADTGDYAAVEAMRAEIEHRLGEPVDVANVTAFLASDASSWLTGLTIDVAGGKLPP